MRLICICDNGETLDIRSAIDQQPFETRSILQDALFYCTTVLPDTPKFFQAEHSLRTALVSFQGSQERYVKSYILSRTLGLRVQKTLRAELIHTSYHIGGPFALVGLFYTTFDAHRNPRTRESLDTILALPEKSRYELFKRAHTFPFNESFGKWYKQIMDKYGKYYQSVAYTLYCFGDIQIPSSLLDRCRSPSIAWDSCGNTVGIPPQMTSPLEDEPRYDRALQGLEYVGLVKSTLGFLRLDHRLGSFIYDASQSHTWEIEAVRLVSHAFPKSQSVHTLDFTSFCEMFLPCLDRVLSFVVKPQVTHYFAQAPSQLVEACLASSYFGDWPWKEKVMSAITNVLQATARDLEEHALLDARFKLRKAQIDRLYNREIPEFDCNIPLLDDRRWNSLLTEIAIWKSHKPIDSNNLTGALETLPTPVVADGLSELDRIAAYRGALVRGCIYRFSGQFQEAYSILSHLPPSNKVTSHLSAILCELGEYDRAVEKLERQIELTPRPNARVRLRACLADAYLCKCMHAAKFDRQDATSLTRARAIYDELRIEIRATTRIEMLQTFAMRAGLAILDQLEGKAAAKEMWEEALHISRTFLKPGYTDVIIYYSMSIITGKQGDMDECPFFGQKAKALLRNTGRQHHFTALGSFWPDLLGNTAESLDLPRISFDLRV